MGRVEGRTEETWEDYHDCLLSPPQTSLFITLHMLSFPTLVLNTVLNFLIGTMLTGVIGTLLLSGETVTIDHLVDPLAFQVNTLTSFTFALSTGLCHFILASHLRRYHFIDQAKTWHEAKRYCRETHTDLATVNDLQDLEDLAGLNEPGKQLVFLGLHREWSWSLSNDDDYKEGEQAYWKWARGQPITHQCGSIGLTGEWFATNCSSMLNFICYNGKIHTYEL